MRALQQAGEVAVVETAEALQEAVAAGKAHIEIRAHLDLTVLDLLDSYILGGVPETVKSIRVRCWFLPPQPASDMRVCEHHVCDAPCFSKCR